MNCRTAKRQLFEIATDRGEQPPMADALREHVDTCPACRELAADGGRLVRILGSASPETMPLDEAFADISRALRRERGPRAWLASRPTSQRIALVTTAVLLVAIANLARLRADYAVYPLGRLGLELLALFGLAVAAQWQWLRPLYRPAVPLAVRWASLAAAVALPAVLAALPMAHANHPASLGGADVIKPAMACLVYGTLLSAPVAVLAFALGRAQRPSLAMGMLVIVGSALAGVLALQIHCPITERVHLLAGHATVPLLLGLLYLAARAAWRRRLRPVR